MFLNVCESSSHKIDQNVLSVSRDSMVHACTQALYHELLLDLLHEPLFRYCLTRRTLQQRLIIQSIQKLATSILSRSRFLFKNFQIHPPDLHICTALSFTCEDVILSYGRFFLLLLLWELQFLWCGCYSGKFRLCNGKLFFLRYSPVIFFKEVM